MIAILVEEFSFGLARGVNITWNMGFILTPHLVEKEYEAPSLPLTVSVARRG
jgi:hypothetical protein